MSKENLKLFIPINKIDEEQRLVYGQVAAEVMDNSGEIFDYEGSKPYFEKWSENAHTTSGGKSRGNLRVMHTSKVAGVVTELGFDDDAKTIDACTKVVDDNEWNMVLAGAYTGFSMGGRYISRVKKDDGINRYIADPVEISLVDKPCIPTATFSVVKADGLVETRRFDESLYQKSDSGETQMPKMTLTNDQVLPVARELAKAAGKSPENDWPEFMDTAREQLIAKGDGADGQPQSEEVEDDANAPAQADEGASIEKADAEEGDEEEADKEAAAKAKADKEAAAKADAEDGEGEAAEKGDNPFADKGKKKKKTAEGEGEDGEGEDEEGEDGEDGEDAEKSDIPELSQVWQASDGTTYIRKADAVSHNEKLAKGDTSPSLSDTLAGLVDVATKIAKGEEVEEAPVPGFRDATIAAVADPLAKYEALLEDDVLAKSMYDVRTLGTILTDLRHIHGSLACNAAWGEEISVLPKEVFDHLVALGDTFVELATEEVKNLIARASKDSAPTTEIMELAASTLGLEKADLEAELAKRAPVVEVVEDDQLQKVAQANQRAEDALAKADALQTEINSITPLVKSLQDQMDAIRRMPRDKAPTTRVVSKGDEADTLGSQIDLSGKSASELADMAIKMAQTQGRSIGAKLPVG